MITEASFDHLVGAQEERLGDRQPKRLGGRQIDDKVKSCRLGGLLMLED
jgi:hypothetical protein